METLAWERCPNLAEHRGSLGCGAVGGWVVAVGGGGRVHNLASVERLKAVAGPEGTRPLRPRRTAPGSGGGGGGGGGGGDGGGDDGGDGDGEDGDGGAEGPGTAAQPMDRKDAALVAAAAVAAAARGDWFVEAPLAVARHALAVAVAPGVANGTDSVPPRLFAAGGWCFGSEGSALMERLDCSHFEAVAGATEEASASSESAAASPAWVQCAPMATPRRLHAAAYCGANGCVYAFGGSAKGAPDLASVERWALGGAARWSRQLCLSDHHHHHHLQPTTHHYYYCSRTSTRTPEPATSSCANTCCKS